MMPKPGNWRSLLFGCDAQSYAYRTYRRFVDRWPLTDENLAKRKRLQETAAKK